MNRAMAEIFGVINAFAAIVIIGVGGLIGHQLGRHYFAFSPDTGTVVGLVGGALVASLICGPMALLVAMLGELTRIRKLAK
jgi:hypothetical protein